MLLLHSFKLLLTSPQKAAECGWEAALAAGVTLSQEEALPTASGAEASHLQGDTGHFGERMEAQEL